jgi:hypothetical protein
LSHVEQARVEPDPTTRKRTTKIRRELSARDVASLLAMIYKGEGKGTK